MSWTEQQIQMLKDMWGHGFSASQIAVRLGGNFSRNAVIGKAHRLKLSSRPSPIHREKGEEGAIIGNESMLSAVTKASSTRKRVMLRPLPVLPTPTHNPAAATREAFRSVEPVVKRSEGIAVTKAGDRQCRWPVGDPRSPDFRFCGCSAHDALPYCIDHARVAYQNIGKKARSSESSSNSHQSSEFRLPSSRY